MRPPVRPGTAAKASPRRRRLPGSVGARVSASRPPGLRRSGLQSRAEQRSGHRRRRGELRRAHMPRPKVRRRAAISAITASPVTTTRSPRSAPETWTRGAQAVGRRLEARPQHRLDQDDGDRRLQRLGRCRAEHGAELLQRGLAPAGTCVRTDPTPGRSKFASGSRRAATSLDIAPMT